MIGNRAIRRGQFGVLALVFFWVIATQSVSAQFISDPNDRIYKFISIWQEKGPITAFMRGSGHISMRQMV